MQGAARCQRLVGNAPLPALDADSYILFKNRGDYGTDGVAVRFYDDGDCFWGPVFDSEAFTDLLARSFWFVSDGRAERTVELMQSGCGTSANCAVNLPVQFRSASVSNML